MPGVSVIAVPGSEQGRGPFRSAMPQFHYDADRYEAQP
jgi:hypothetical protein